MSSQPQRSHVDSAHSRHSARAKRFEENESDQATALGPGSVYDDAELTELAVPPPAAENDDMRDTYEKEEEKIQRTSSSLRREDQDDGELTELAAPAPISHRG